jgi:plasmid replication initiation protein
MSTDKLTVYKSNAVIQAGYQLTLNEQRVVLAAIGLVDPRKELLVTDRFELSAKNFCKLFEVSEKNAYKALIEVAQTLFKRYVTIENPFPDKPNINKLQTHWISSICYMDKEGKIAITFAPDLIPYLSQLKGSFTRYELKHVGNMTSTYGIRLYELLIQWKTAGKREIEIAQLKRLFELDSSYDRMFDLKKRVIDPAVKDINTHSNFSVQWEQRKTGRNVTHLIFTFAEKKPPEPQQPQAATTPAEAKPKADIILTEEQQKCFEWARNQDFWKKHARSKQGFLKCFHDESAGELSLKGQWSATLPKAAQPKKEKSAAALKREEDLKIINLKNELANLENLNKLSPNAAIKQQIADKKRELEELSKYKT